MNRTIAFVAAVMGCSSASPAQTSVMYRLDPGSQLTAEFCTTGKCLCPPHQFDGPVGGTFTLTLIQHGPVFSEYSVNSVSWVASLPIAAIRFTGSGTYRIGGEVGLTHQLQLVLMEDNLDPVHYDSGLVPTDPLHPFPAIAITTTSEAFGCRLNRFLMVGQPTCYADCDASGALNINDFVCFQGSFAAGDPYANCDGSSVQPTLNVNDFVCFLNRFLQGCP